MYALFIGWQGSEHMSEDSFLYAQFFCPVPFLGYISSSLGTGVSPDIYRGP